MAKRDYLTATEKAEAAFDEKLDGLNTQRERREVLEQAAGLIPNKVLAGEPTINGVPQVELEKAEPVEVEPNAYPQEGIT